MGSILKIFDGFIPASARLPARYLYKRLRGGIDAELLLVPAQVSRRRRAVDVGANIGMYSYALSRNFDSVEAFEPSHACTPMLAAYASRAGNVRVHNVGLSDQPGTAALHVPFLEGRQELNFGLASVSAPVGAHQDFQIPLHRLDDYSFDDVDFIKIDVEGHEIEVIRGALRTIRSTMPVLLVEVEQRHLVGSSVGSTIAEIRGLGYECSFLQNGRLVTFDRFDLERDQLQFLENPYHSNYVNNFIFQPCSRG